jgi:2,5-diketo-D-gluconate reductase B
MQHVEAKGIKVPALGFGTWKLAGSDAERMVRAALDIGYRHVDTAQAYGNEAEVGRAIEASGVPREDVFLTTKVWMDKLAYGDLQRSAEQSLRLLRTDRVDLLLVHWPNPQVPLGDTLRALAELKRDGKVRTIGVSNFPVALLREAVEEYEADLLCDQVEYHALLSQKVVLDWLRAHDMMLTAYSPLAQGRLAGHPVLAEIGRRIGRSPAQVALRWLLDQERVAVIPKSSSERRARENFEVLGFTLDEADFQAVSKLQGAGRQINPGWAPDWDPI